LSSGGRGEAKADGGSPPVRFFLAGNPGPLTFDGTRSYVVGERSAAVIDPGPVLDVHLAALVAAVEPADSVVVLVTHGHGDHAAGAGDLAERIGAEVWGPAAGRDLGDGQEFTTDRGELVTVSTPGHSRRHFCYHLPRHGAVFTGDLILGEGDTTWVGEYPGGVAEYLTSLDRLEALGARVLHPGHGEPIHDPAEAIARFRRHRLSRIDQVRRAIEQTGSTDARTLTRHVYGPLPPDLFDMAASGVEGILDYLSGSG
jgi:glyoxylase-like metal-dependent hydrolase (beta-lactamase superfamily II)